MSLQIYLPGQHMIVFNPNKDPNTVRGCAKQERTMLTTFFELNKSNTLAHQYTYQEIPLHFVWDQQNKLWTQQQYGSTIGHVYFISPTASEQFYLHSLLTTVKGPTSWEDICTYESVLYPTFHATCLARGLLKTSTNGGNVLKKLLYHTLVKDFNVFSCSFSHIVSHLNLTCCGRHSVTNSVITWPVSYNTQKALMSKLHKIIFMTSVSSSSTKTFIFMAHCCPHFPRCLSFKEIRMTTVRMLTLLNNFITMPVMKKSPHSLTSLFWTSNNVTLSTKFTPLFSPKTERLSSFTV